jgi:CRP-like cAMP-binding protein
MDRKAERQIEMNVRKLLGDWEDIVEYPAQTVVFSERTPSDLLYVILSGEVELTLNGKSIGIETEGGIIGEMAMIDSASRNATATTLTSARLARLNPKQLKKLVSRNAKFSLHVMGVLANRLRAVDNYIITQFEQDG